jgi:hypothetical protein
MPVWTFKLFICLFLLGLGQWLSMRCAFDKCTARLWIEEWSYRFNFHGSVLRNYYSDIYPTRCNFTQFILSGNCSTCFGWYFHPSSGAQTTVSTTSGICHIVTATCRYRGRVGTGLSVLWVAYAIYLKFTTLSISLSANFVPVLSSSASRLTTPHILLHNWQFCQHNKIVVLT